MLESFNLYIFGGTGDLAQRKLLPALYRQDLLSSFSKDSKIIALGTKEMTNEEYKLIIRNSLLKYSKICDLDNNSWDRFSERISYKKINIKSEPDWFGFAKPNKCIGSIYYLATPPALYKEISIALQKNNLINHNSRIVVEKPIGSDYASALEINNALADGFNENQIYRIDHYLGKEAVQNLLALRFANVIFENIWSNSAIDNIQITVAENLSLEGRGDYYDKTGALKDMVQNHLLQILCLVAMEPPTDITSESVRDEKLKVLKSLALIDKNNINSSCIRGQYSEGSIDNTLKKRYLDEGGVGKGSATETFVALKIMIDNWRWAGVPFYLRTGKNMAKKCSEIVIEFKSIPHNIFGKDKKLNTNQLILKLQPDEGIQLKLMTKEPSVSGFNLKELPLDLVLNEYHELGHQDCYERLLLDVIKGNPALFMRRDEVEASWVWIDRLVELWDQIDIPLHEYPSGSWGPSASDLMVDKENRSWKNGK